MAPICASEGKMPSRLVKGVQRIGHRVINSVLRLGVASRFFLPVATLLENPP